MNGEGLMIPVQITRDMIEQGRDGRFRMKGRWGMRCRGRNGVIKWHRKWDNLITNEGLNLILNTFFGSTSKGTIYIGLKATGSPNAADTMASHAGWTEITSYDESVRQTATFGSASSQAIDNAGSVAEFTLSATVDVYGAFSTTNSTKGGSTGTLISVGNFGDPEAGDDGDTLEVTLEYNVADDGA